MVMTATHLTELGPYVAGELVEPWMHTFADSAGTPIDLTGFTAMLAYRLSGGARVARTAAMADAVNGVTEYQWADADLASAGLLRGELVVGDGTHRYARSFVMWLREPAGGVLPAPPGVGGYVGAVLASGGDVLTIDGDVLVVAP